MVYVRSHIRDGYWVQSYYRRSPEEAQSLETCRKKHVQELAELCSDLITDGWQDTVEKRAADYVTNLTWHKVRRGRNCKVLAALAKGILACRQEFHNLTGEAARFLTSLLGGNNYEQALADELLKRLPLPWDAKLTAAARGIQIAGIFICVADGTALTRCQCFIDLARTEAPEYVKSILAAALDDWAHLGNIPPGAITS